MRVRTFTEAGVEEFRKYLLELHQDPSKTRPDLNRSQYSTEFGTNVEVDETRTFSTRFELAEYLHECFSSAGLARRDIMTNSNLWTWLAYLYFDQLCPVKNNVRHVHEMSRYIYSSHYTDYYRHYVAGAYDLYTLHGAKFSKLFLCSPPFELNEYTEQLASRQFIISNKVAIQTAYALFWDGSAKKPREGRAGKGPGSVRHFAQVLGQLELTYDIHSMDMQTLIELLPRCFRDCIDG